MVSPVFVLVAVFVALLFSLPSSDAGLGQATALAAPTGGPGTTSSVPTIGDGGTLYRTSSGHTIALWDTVASLASGLSERSYTIRLQTTVPDKSLGIVVETNPMQEWAQPRQMPGGPDALPAWTDWSWKVMTASGHNDTANWTAQRWTHDLTRSSVWTNQSYLVIGESNPSLALTMLPQSQLNVTSPSVGLVLAPPVTGSSLIPGNASKFAAFLSTLHPSILRFGPATAQANGTWSLSTNSPSFNYGVLDQAFNVSASVGASVLFDLSAGSWGDGNILPKHMPLNTSVVVEKNPSEVGYFPTSAAYATYVKVLVDHIIQLHETVAYWSIGNEVPLNNLSVVDGYIRIFNVAQKVIHALLPTALVGSDALTNRTYISDFAKGLKHVGFLAFHFYPAIGMCLQNGSYCPPAGPGLGTVDSRLWMPFASMTGNLGFLPPTVAQQTWYNLTGRWVPVLDTESNLNGIGGGALTLTTGTDPRQQTLFGAAWTIATVITGADQNLSTFLYYSASGPWPTPTNGSGRYGGWGFGLSAETSTDHFVRYAPYWALRMWTRYVPAGAPGALLPVSDPSVARVYESKTPTGLSLVVVGLTAIQMNLTIDPPTSGGTLVARSSSVLDQRSYVELYNSTSSREVLGRSGVTHRTYSGAKNSVNLTLDGYGVAIVHFEHVKSAASPARPYSEWTLSSASSPSAPASGGFGLLAPPSGEGRMGVHPAAAPAGVHGPERAARERPLSRIPAV